MRHKPKQKKAVWFIAKYGPTPPPPLRKRVNPVSVRRRADIAEYGRRKKKFLRAHPFCQACPVARPTMPPHPSCQVHHKLGRKGTRYLDTATWLAVCPECHRRIHDDPRWAKDKNLLGSFHS